MKKTRLAALVIAATVTSIFSPCIANADTYTIKEVDTLGKMQELDEKLNPGKNGVCEVTLYEGQKTSTSGTQGMLLPVGCFTDDDFCMASHLETESECNEYEPWYSTDRGYYGAELTNTDNRVCQIVCVVDSKTYSYSAGDEYRYVNFNIYAIQAGDYVLTFNHYNDYVKTYEDYLDDEGFEWAREVENSSPTIDYTFKLKIHVLPQETEKRYYVVKPGASLLPKTPAKVATRYYVSSHNDIKVTNHKIALHKYEKKLTIKDNKKNVFTQDGNKIVTKKSKAEYGQWISMYAPYYYQNGGFYGVTEYSRFHVTVSDTNLNYTKKTMKVGDTIKLKIKDGTTFAKAEAFQYTKDEEIKFALAWADKSYASSFVENEKKQPIKFAIQKKGYVQKEEAFKYITIKATKKGKCLIKVYPYEDDEEYFFVCEINVQ